MKDSTCKKISIKHISFILSAMLLTAAAVTLLILGSVRTRSEAAENIRYSTYVVQDGDTIWSIAQDHMSGKYSDCRDYVKDVMRVNRMKKSLIHPGDLIAIPVQTDEQPGIIASAR